MGDPAGVSAELMAKLLASPHAADARILAIGDARLYQRGAREAGVTLDLEVTTDSHARPGETRPVLLDTRDLDPAAVRLGEVSDGGGRSAIANYAKALDLAKAGVVEAITFTPFNKQAIRLGLPGYEDELVFAAEHLHFGGRYAEFNVIDEFWNARVTSHVPLREVAGLLTEERIIDRLELTRDALLEAGIENPRIGVAALNPHAGDGGAFGREEINLIGPAVEKAKAMGLPADGPYPSDTVFWRAVKGQFDAVLTMYHDQGQIAIKLLGFDHGVTVLGGPPSPSPPQPTARPTTSPARTRPTPSPRSGPSRSPARWQRGGGPTPVIIRRLGGA
jgi:4-hydroxythreonine-4-phosphate dehydrogenase